MPKNNYHDSRLGVLQVGSYLLCLVVLVKLFYIQVIQNKKYSVLASQQHWDSRIILPKRGDILSSDGFPLATSKPSFILFSENQKIEDPVQASSDLATILYEESTDQTLEEFEQSLKEGLSKDLSWVPLQKKVSEDTKREIEALEIDGLGFEEEPVRFYPEGSLASHVLGYVAGSERNFEQGYFGIEGFFDGDLRGKPGRILEERGATGDVILAGGYKKVPSQDGRGLVLTLNREVEYMAELKLKEAVEKFEAKSASVVIMNPENGDIIAMASYPTFDPSSSDSEISESTESQKIQKKNVAIAEVYEPGSVLKPLTVSAALDLNLVTPDSTFDDDGPKVYSGHRIDNWDGKHLGIQTITQLLEKSNNIGAAYVGMKVGTERLYDYFRKFGLSELSGVALEGENTGSLRDPSEWRDIDLATAAFGQGVSVSQLQLATAFSVFDNGGFLVKPRIVSEIVDGTRSIELPAVRKRQVLATDTARIISLMLVSAVDKGEAKFFNIKGYSVAGKTGTAQIPVDGRYDPDKTNATFAGFLPNAPLDKKFVMVVRVEEPESSIYAAETAVPLWMNILRELVVLYKIPPDRL